MEYCNEGDLMKLLNEKKQLKEEEAINYLV